MPVGKQTQEFFARMEKEAKKNPLPPIEEIPLKELRETTMVAFKEYAGSLPVGVTSSSFQHCTYAVSAEYSVHATVYTPTSYSSDSCYTVIFFQGNGFIFDMLESHLPGFARMANLANCKVIGIATPLAPEYSAQQINDISYKTVRYLLQKADTLDINSNHVVLAGYSAGGNIVANIINRAKMDETIRIKHQLLLSPSLDLSLETRIKSPYREFQEQDKSASIEGVRFIVQHYYKDNDPKSPLISPMFEENLAGIPDTTIIVAEFDAARGDGHAYADRLKQAGVSVNVIICKEQTHNYFIARGVMNDGIDPAIEMAQVIKQLTPTQKVEATV